MALSWNEIKDRAEAFESEAKRMEFLFELYGRYTAPMMVVGGKKRGRK